MAQSGAGSGSPRLEGLPCAGCFVVFAFTISICLLSTWLKARSKLDPREACSLMADGIFGYISLWPLVRKSEVEEDEGTWGYFLELVLQSSVWSLRSVLSGLHQPFSPAPIGLLCPFNPVLR